MRRRLGCAIALCCAGCGPAKLPRIDLAAQRAPSRWEVVEPAGALPRRRDPRTGIVFVRIPAGEFTMGGTAENDAPPHRVSISRPFWIAETEVTVAQWRTFVRRDGGPGDAPAATTDDRLPIGGVSWLDATAFCETYGYALPTEAQWERACRGDAGEPWRDRAALERTAWVYSNSGERASPVASREPNSFGLFDMLGNLWEWCADGYVPGYVVPDPNRPLVDPVAPEGSPFRVVRGGSWFSVPVPWPSDRSFERPAVRSHLFGFRPVRAADDA